VIRDPSDRRRFTRIHFDAECEVHYKGGALVMNLVDISLRGVLMKSDKTLDIQLDDPATLSIYLANDVLIRMPSRLCHLQPPYYGFDAEEMDLESISHLRRLVELNLGDEMLLERELEQMFPQEDEPHEDKP